MWTLADSLYNDQQPSQKMLMHNAKCVKRNSPHEQTPSAIICRSNLYSKSEMLNEWLYIATNAHDKGRLWQLKVWNTAITNHNQANKLIKATWVANYVIFSVKVAVVFLYQHYQLWIYLNTGHQYTLKKGLKYFIIFVCLWLVLCTHLYQENGMQTTKVLKLLRDLLSQQKKQRKIHKNISILTNIFTVPCHFSETLEQCLKSHNHCLELSSDCVSWENNGGG
jgi:hypothetical protein